jgi:hypothetical protein
MITRILQADGEASVSLWVRAVQAVLLANAVPAFVVLAFFPDRTEQLFVWTVKPEASAQLLAAMYGNAALLTLLTLGHKSWPQIRVAFVVFTLFALAATVVTFFHLDPFLAHPRYFFAYWLLNYFFLCFAAPYVFIREQRASRRAAVSAWLSTPARVVSVAAGSACLVTGIAMFGGPTWADHVWPWPTTPLVARIIAVWMIALAAAFVWAVHDGDAHRARPILAQGLPTALLIGIVPLLHRGDLIGGAGHWLIFALLLATLATAGAAGARTVSPRS